MKSLKATTLFLLLLPALASLQAKPKKPYKLPEAFNNARYVYVEAIDGQEFDPRLLPDDRQAIADVTGALDDWKRYVLTMHRGEADLIFVVRKGRAASATVGGQIGTRSQRIPSQSPNCQSPNDPSQAGQSPNSQSQNCQMGGSGIGVGGEVGPPDDLLEVYMRGSGGGHGTLLWQHSLADGLNAPDLMLFRQLRDEVERTYPKP